MHLYNLTLQQPTAIGIVAIGNFSGAKQQEIIVSRGAGSILELMRVDPQTGKMHSVLTHHVMGITRSVVAFRLTGSSKDYIIVGSDSGRITVLEYNPQKNALERVHQETFGKSGVRRIVPGEYLAADPKGRAVLIGSVEKQKFVYVLNRDSAAKLTISSPLEAHKSHSVCYHVVGVDVGFENPIFAALEVDHTESDQDPSGEAFAATEKQLVYYELDLGLNHVVRKWAEAVEPRANMLIAVPGGTDGPSGVLVCSEGFITWRHQGFRAVRVPIPRRPGGQGNRIIVSAVTHKMKNLFFVLAQTEDGDVFKITLQYRPGTEGASNGVDAVVIKYFDTLPVSSGMCLFKSGFLFLAAEFGNHILYQVDSLGDEDDTQVDYSSAQFPQLTEEGEDEDEDFDYSTCTFHPRPLLNLIPVDELESYAPLIDAKILNLTEDDAPQLYALCGKAGRSSMRMLKHGLEVSEVAVSELPGNPNAVWTVRSTSQDEFDSYIVVSFVNATLVLSIGETVEEVTDTGFLGTTPTIGVAQLGEDALLQIYPQGLRHIRRDRRVNEWKAPGGRGIVKAACNGRQVVIALTGGELVYFELDQAGHLNEFQERRDMGGAGITALTLGRVEPGRLRSRFLAVGCSDMTVRLLSLDPDSTLEPVAMQATNAIPESLLLTDLQDANQTADMATLYLYIGLQNGLLLRTIVDSVTAALSDTRLRFLGPRAVRLHPVTIGGANAVLALSARPWLAYTYQGRNQLAPLSYEHLEWGSSFSSEQCPEGIVAISANTLRILTVEKLGVTLNQTSVPLKYTPRRFVYHALARKFVVIEAEHNALCPSEVKRLEAGGPNANQDAHELATLPAEQFGVPRAEQGKWASCIRVVDPFSGLETTHLIELDENEAAFSVTTVVFAASPNEMMVAVGTGKDVVLSPRTCSSGFIRIYRIGEGGKELQLLHVTPLEDVPYALCAFQGRLLVGMGNILRIYDLGKKRMLRKSENKQTPCAIVALQTQGDRIIINDIQESVHYAMYQHMANRIIIFADDTIPRWTTATTMTDYDTVAGGDKFGNFWIVRLPGDVSADLDDDPTGNKLTYEKPYLQGAPHKLQHVAETFIGDTITSIQKATLTTGAREVLAYTTLLGSFGMLVPFISKEDVDFFQNLEMHLRIAAPPLLGRSHLAYRSSYVPVRNVIDGDLCEQYLLLPPEKRAEIAEQLDRTPAEVARKIEELRQRNGF